MILVLGSRGDGASVAVIRPTMRRPRESGGGDRASRVEGHDDSEAVATASEREGRA